MGEEMRKILIQTGQGANYYIRLTWVHALANLNHQVVFWDRNVRSPLDIFYEFRPDIFIGSTWQLDRALIKALAKYQDTKVLLCANNWGEDDEEIKKQFPIEFASDTEKKNVEMLKNLTGKPDYVFCQYHNSYAVETHKLWANLGIIPFGMLLSADLTDYKLTPPSKDYITDITFVGGYWPYKAKQIAPYLFPLTNTPLNVKIFGFGGWPVPNFLGNISSQNACRFYSSAKVCPNIFEPHSLALGYDINQRTYQIAAAGGFQICQNVAGIKKDVFSNDEIVFADNQEDFITKVLYYIANPDKRFEYIKRSVDTVYACHTNYHRVATILNKLDLSNEAHESFVKAEEMYGEINRVIQQPEFEQRYLELYS